MDTLCRLQAIRPVYRRLRKSEWRRTACGWATVFNSLMQKSRPQTAFYRQLKETCFWRHQTQMTSWMTHVRRVLGPSSMLSPTRWLGAFIASWQAGGRSSKSDDAHRIAIHGLSKIPFRCLSAILHRSIFRSVWTISSACSTCIVYLLMNYHIQHCYFLKSTMILSDVDSSCDEQTSIQRNRLLKRANYVVSCNVKQMFCCL